LAKNTPVCRTRLFVRRLLLKLAQPRCAFGHDGVNYDKNGANRRQEK